MPILLRVAEERADNLEDLGIVLATGLRCLPHQGELLEADGWHWLTYLRHRIAPRPDQRPMTCCRDIDPQPSGRRSA